MAESLVSRPRSRSGDSRSGGSTSGTRAAHTSTKQPRSRRAEQRAEGRPKTDERKADGKGNAARQGVTLLRSALDLPQASFSLVLASAGLLVGIGIIMVLSSSSYLGYARYDDAYYFVKRQALFLMIGLVAAFVLSRLSIAQLRVLGWFGLALAYILLLLTYTPLGVENYGNRNWLNLGIPSLGLQPSEFAKLAVVVWGADVLARKEKLLDQPRHLLIPYLPGVGLVVLLVVFQHDLGTAIVFAGIIAGVLFVVGVPLWVFGGMAALGGLAVAFLVQSNESRMKRLLGFLNPNSALQGVNYQPFIGILAVASGGWWGLGLGRSLQKWGSLTQPHTDFIFAVTAEELGLFGSLLILALFGVLCYAGIRIALRSDNPFCRYAAAGVTSWLMFQALVNIAVVLRLLPVLGVPLPFISYGGSALLANLMALGVLLVCARNEPDARRAAERARLRRAARRKPEVSAVTTGRGKR